MITYENLPKEHRLLVAPRVYATYYSPDRFELVQYASKSCSGKSLATLTPEFTRINFTGPADTLKKLFDINTKLVLSKTDYLNRYIRRWSLGGTNSRQSSIYGKPPIIMVNGTLHSLTDPFNMVVDKEKKREVDRMITSIKKMVTIRDKLGAFQIQPPDMNKSTAMRDVISGATGHDGSYMGRVYSALCDVRPEALNSFTPLLYMSRRFKWVRNNWRDAINQMLNTQRQELYIYTGAITFTPIQPPTIEEILNGTYKSVELLSTDGV